MHWESGSLAKTTEPSQSTSPNFRLYLIVTLSCRTERWHPAEEKPKGSLRKERVT